MFEGHADRVHDPVAAVARLMIRRRVPLEILVAGRLQIGIGRELGVEARGWRRYVLTEQPRTYEVPTLSGRRQIRARVANENAPLRQNAAVATAGQCDLAERARHAVRVHVVIIS